MACTRVGLGSIVVLFISVLFNILSFSLPLWSTSKVADYKLELKVDFRAGVWGYYTDIKHNKGNWAKNFSSVSICDAYGKVSGIGVIPRKGYASALAIHAGINPERFDLFLGNTCGALGYASLVIAVFALSFGVFALLGVVLGVTCCANESRLNAVSKVFIALAFVCNVVTFSLWIAQAHPLHSDHVTLSTSYVSYGASFVLNVLSAVGFVLSGALLARHSAMTKAYVFRRPSIAAGECSPIRVEPLTPRGLSGRCDRATWVR